jgi:hypothetical protein
MTILSIGNFYNPSWDGSLPDEEHIAKALEDAGHEVERLQRESLEDPTTTGSNGLYGYDFILIAQWDGYPDNLDKLPQTPLIYWAFDHQADGQEWHERLVKASDLYLSKRIADSKYSNWRWLSQDFSPSFLKPYDHEIKKDIDVLFTGSYLPWATERNETLKAIDEKFNLVIHSVNAWDGFKDVRPPIMDEGLPELYARARVILSIDHIIEAGYWSDRNAQIIACGRQPLFWYVPLSEARFGNRVQYFYNIDDCLEKIKNWKELPVNADNLYVKDRVKDLLTIVRSIL